MGDYGELYEDAVATYGAALGRLARGYEADADRRRDLLQLIHIAIWRSLRLFDGRCGLGTWVYRIAHNVAATHVLRSRRASSRLIGLEALEAEPGLVDGEAEAHRRDTVARAAALDPKTQAAGSADYPALSRGRTGSINSGSNGIEAR